MLFRSARSIGKPNMDVEVDGGVSEANCAEIIKAGANVLVAGSTVFNSLDTSVTIRRLRGI